MGNNTEKYKYLFGPVPSRRLGLSLGVDLLPHKTCTLDCVYCESGKTTNLTIDRKMYVPVGSVIDELSAYLSTAPKIDYITFSGSGEPTLNIGISEVVAFLKNNYPHYKIALLTNSTLFYREDVRNDVLDVDLVIASIDAVSEKVFLTINRPEKKLDMTTVITGLELFREKYKNELWIEVFVIPGQNDSDYEIKRINNAVKRIRPDKIQLNSLDRPAVEEWVVPADKICLNRVISQLNAAEIINKAEIQGADSDCSSNNIQRILGLIKRRPCTIDDIIISLGISELKAEEYLEELVGKKMISCEKMERGFFYKLIIK